MSAMHPVAIVNTASITSLARMTLYHHSISVYHAKIKTNEDKDKAVDKVQDLGQQTKDKAATTTQKAQE